MELLDKRSLQCYRCLERKPVQQHCSSSEDRRGYCYRYGETRHLARDCGGRTRCPVGRPADHRVGNVKCISSKRRTSTRGAKLPPSPGKSQPVKLAEIIVTPSYRGA
ncbi:hypothetical protein ACFW04_014581 [Cataglyphis niger]